MARRSLTQEEIEDAKRLKKLWIDRKDKLHLSQAKAAKELGFSSQAAVSQYINARTPLNMQSVAKFARLLRLTVDDISPRYGKMVGKPNPAELDDYVPTPTGSLGGIPTSACLTWFAFSKEFLSAYGVDKLKIVRVEDDSYKEYPVGSIFIVTEKRQEKFSSGLFFLQQEGGIVLRKIVCEEDCITIHGPKKIKMSSDAVGLLNILGQAVAEVRNV